MYRFSRFDLEKLESGGQGLAHIVLKSDSADLMYLEMVSTFDLRLRPGLP